MHVLGLSDSRKGSALSFFNRGSAGGFCCSFRTSTASGLARLLCKSQEHHAHHLFVPLNLRPFQLSMPQHSHPFVPAFVPLRPSGWHWPSPHHPVPPLAHALAARGSVTKSGSFLRLPPSCCHPPNCTRRGALCGGIRLSSTVSPAWIAAIPAGEP